MRHRSLARGWHEIRAAVVRRTWERVRRPFQRYLAPLDGRAVRRALDAAGVEPGTTLVVHSSLGRLGHLDGGPEALVDALLEAAGPSGTIVMPTFPIARSMEEWIDSGATFDVRTTPSRMGVVTEVFRRRPDVMRSLHPTHPMAARGPRAAELLVDHERSRTPYGAATPYGRLAESTDAFVLMLETHVHSLLHHIQERVEFPNLFRDGERDVPYVDRSGVRSTMRTRVMRPRLPYFVAIPAVRGDAPDWAILHDYALMFPRRREREARRLGYRFLGFPPIRERRADLVRRGLLRTSRIGRGELGLLHVPSFVALLESELRGLVERFRAVYDPERIEALGLPYS